MQAPSDSNRPSGLLQPTLPAMMSKGKEPLNSNLPSSTEKAKNSKKRKREDAFGMNSIGMDKGVDEVLA